jgi:tetratricopeptide (TPR) repeat protein
VIDMFSNRHGLGLVLMIAGLLVHAPVGAQGHLAGRAQEAMELTDRRIELAEAAVPDEPPSPATAELQLARQIQGRARAAYGGGQYVIAERTTVEARTHADRAIAIVRGLPDPDRVLIQVERTSELVERSRDRLADCDETRARSLLRVGYEMQGRAEVAARESRYLAALQLTMSARERLQKAMRLCNVAESLGETASRALQRTDDVLARAREIVDEGAPEEALRALRRAGALQSEARAEYSSSHFERSLQLTQHARVIAQRVVRREPPPRPGSRGGPPR